MSSTIKESPVVSAPATIDPNPQRLWSLASIPVLIVLMLSVLACSMTHQVSDNQVQSQAITIAATQTNGDKYELPVTQIRLVSVTKSPTPQPFPAWCQVTTGGDPLNIRKAPGLDAEIIGGAVDGVVLNVTGIDGDWLAITTTSGFSGYVFSLYCL